MSKGNSKKEMLERFESMGIPKPVKPVHNPKAPAKNPEMASKMDQIRNGALKGSFQTFIEKSEKVSKAPTALPVPKVGKKPQELTQSAPAIKSFTTKNSQAAMYENALYGDVSSTPASSYDSYSNGNVDEFGPTHVDTRSRLAERLRERQNNIKESSEYFEDHNSYGLNLTEAELTEKITEIAKQVSTKMIKSVILELSKKEGGLIMESKSVRKAEVVGKNKVKIGGKTYLLKPVKD
jgi:hypothetical protein